jgi:transposase
LTTVCNDTVINAEAVCELLRKLSARYAGLPVTLVLDNARYQRCAVVQELAKGLRIELLFLPAYSPNLNLIERLWKFVKKECLSCRYYEDFARFKAAIVECLEGVEGALSHSVHCGVDSSCANSAGSAWSRVQKSKVGSFKPNLR